MIDSGTPRTTFEDLGLPKGTVVERLCVNEPAKALVLQIRVKGDPFPRRRLLGRQFDEEAYSELVPHVNGQDLDSLMPSPVSPHVYYNRMLYCGDGGDWSGLFRVHCTTRVVECLLDSSNSTSDWVAEIVGISSDGQRIFVMSGSDAGYFVSEFSLSTRALTHLVPLPAVFA